MSKSKVVADGRVVGSEAFMMLRAGAQALYFHACRECDYMGVIDSVQLLARKCGATEADAAELMARGYVLPFEVEPGVTFHLVAHNWVNNSTQGKNTRRLVGSSQTARIIDGLFSFESDEYRKYVPGEGGAGVIETLMACGGAAPSDTPGRGPGRPGSLPGSLPEGENGLGSLPGKLPSSLAIPIPIPKPDKTTWKGIGVGGAGEGEEGNPEKPIANQKLTGLVSGGEGEGLRALPAEPPAPPSRPRAPEPPTLAEVLAYASGASLDVDAAAFCSHFAANGWTYISEPMGDWRAALRAWDANGRG